MQKQSKVFEDISKVATSALGTLAGVGREMEEQARRRMRDLASDEDAVSRDEFEAVKANALAAREAVEALKADVAALKAELAGTPAKAPAGTGRAASANKAKPAS